MNYTLKYQYQIIISIDNKLILLLIQNKIIIIKDQ